VGKTLAAFETIWPSSEACDQALAVFAPYHRHSLGMLDVLIGQTAVELDLPLYTFNRKHYQVIPNLATVEPYRKG
jgi:predicted nucleic acid-binding protein